MNAREQLELLLCPAYGASGFDTHGPEVRGLLDAYRAEVLREAAGIADRCAERFYVARMEDEGDGAAAIARGIRRMADQTGGTP